MFVVSYINQFFHYHVGQADSNTFDPPGGWNEALDALEPEAQDLQLQRLVQQANWSMR